MSKKASSQFIELAFAFAILSSFLGFKETLNIVKKMLSMFNSILVSFFDTTILNVMFKYFIVFPIVGLILVMLDLPRGKTGHWVGKILYFVVGYGIGFILDFISRLIF